jgi:hypothetical protein
MTYSMTGQEKGELLIQVWLDRGDHNEQVWLNRGDHMGRFDLIEVTTWAGLT